MQTTTAQQQGFVGNVEQETVTTDLEGALTNFANVSAAYREALAQLTDTNATLHKNISLYAAQNSDLQYKMALLKQQVQQMSLA